MSLQPTRTEELPEIGAVHVLAVDIFLAVMDAYYPETGHRLGLWTALPVDKKREYITAAKTLLDGYRPASILAFPPPDDLTPLCIYCTRQPAMPGSEYCSTQCVINSETD